MGFMKRSFESHSVTTDDGYKLTLLKIPSALGDTGKPPVLMVHGLISQGTHWFMNTPQKDLPYKLASEGYDCWLANLRGTPLSRSHVNVSSRSNRFWDFSWHEMGQFDIPAMIDYILAHSGKDRLSYIGHSMGCAVFFVTMALRPDYNEKVNIMVALAPSVYGRHISNRLARLSVPIGTFVSKIKTLYSREIFPMTLIAYAKKLLPFLTLNPERVGCWILRNFATRVGVMSNDQIERNRMLTIAGELPSPTSLKTFCHGTQCFSADKFQYYDYGKIENFQRYGEPEPPTYELEKTIVPVALFHSIGDQLCTIADVNKLANDLPNIIGNFGIKNDCFAHTDFMFGKDADKLVYGKILDVFSEMGMDV